MTATTNTTKSASNHSGHPDPSPAVTAKGAPGIR
jgi:hypothetical protein